MTLFQSIILGIVQGLTEYLPISSSAHLVLVPYLLGWNLPEDQVFVFDVLVQMGTLIAVIVYFWKDLWKIATGFIQAIIQRKPFVSQDARMGWYIILATIPAGIAGITIKDVVEQAFNSPMATALLLLVTSGLLITAEIIGKRTKNLEDITWKEALMIGIGQALSVFPGVSRSGSTIAAGMSQNLDRPSAARFSFLMAIPIMAAAGLLTSLDLLDMPSVSSFLPVVLVGTLVAAVVGYASIHWLLSFLTRKPLYGFAIYCALVSVITIITNYVR